MAIPAKVVAIDAQGDNATVVLGEVKKEVSLALVEDVSVDDFELIHVGYALNKVSEEELEQMKRNFYGFDPSYHVARYNFVYKVAKSRTPLTLANHRWSKTIRRVS